jgi:hypothetical protein
MVRPSQHLLWQYVLRAILFLSYPLRCPPRPASCRTIGNAQCMHPLDSHRTRKTGTHNRNRGYNKVQCRRRAVTGSLPRQRRPRARRIRRVMPPIIAARRPRRRPPKWWKKRAARVVATLARATRLPGSAACPARCQAPAPLPDLFPTGGS